MTGSVIDFVVVRVCVVAGGIISAPAASSSAVAHAASSNNNVAERAMSFFMALSYVCFVFFVG